MSFGKGSSTQPDTAQTDTGLQDEQVSNSQESVPVPVLYGESRIAVKWISRIYNQRAVEAPLATPGKK